MSGLLVALSVVLAIVVLLAAAGKIIDGSDLRTTLREIRVPRVLIGPITRMLPMVELACGIALLAPPTARQAAIATSVLFAAFTAVTTLAVLRGLHAPCNCFGGWSDHGMSWWTVARNAALTAGAVILAVTGGALTTVPGWLGTAAGGRAHVAVTALATAVVVLAAFAAHLANRTRSRHGVIAAALPDGTVGVRQRAAALRGAPGSLADIAPARTALVVFVDPRCAPCRALMPTVAVWRRQLPATAALHVVCTGEAESCGTEFGRLPDEVLLHDGGRALRRLAGVRAMPGAVMLHRDGSVIASAIGAAAIARLVEDVRSTSDQPNAPLAVGDFAGDVQLSDMNGESLPKTTLAGRMSVLVFWEPGRADCQTLLPDLLLWQRRLPQRGPHLVVVTSGAQHLAALTGQPDVVVLRGGGNVLRAFGVTAAPSAVLLDAGLRVASPVMQGPGPVMKLAARAELLADAGERLSALAHGND